MANLILRVVTNAGDTTKGTPLTNVELDGNFVEIGDQLALKAPIASPTFTGTVTIPGGTINATSVGAVTRSTGAFTTLSANGLTEVTDNTESTSTTTGALTVTGGVGIAGAINVGGDSSFTTTGWLKLPAGTTAQRPAGVDGAVRYNSSTLKFEGYGNSTWAPLNSPDVTDDTTTNAEFFVTLSSTSAGKPDGLVASSTQLYFNPSTGTLSATAFNTLSDERYKTNIETVVGAVDVVRQLNGVSFEYTTTGKKSYGVIAQELEQVLPDLVAGDDPKTVNYDGIIAFLINAVKELDSRVKTLEAKG